MLSNTLIRTTKLSVALFMGLTFTEVSMASDPYEGKCNACGVAMKNCENVEKAAVESARAMAEGPDKRNAWKEIFKRIQTCQVALYEGEKAACENCPNISSRYWMQDFPLPSGPGGTPQEQAGMGEQQQGGAGAQ